MVYRGKPSAGCENCRKAKKRCGLEQPACVRCVKLRKVCSGYRDTTQLQIQDESEAVRQKANKPKRRSPPLKIARPGANGTIVTTSTSAGSSTTPMTPGGAITVVTPRSEHSNPTTDSGSTDLALTDPNALWRTPDAETAGFQWNTAPVLDSILPKADEMAVNYFYEQFTASSGHWTFLRDASCTIAKDPLLEVSMKACGMAALHNVRGVVMGREYARSVYGEAISLLNTALRDPKMCRLDSTLISVAMLGYYENLVCDSTDSVRSWKAHISGATQLLRIRGKSQFKSSIGRMLYRELRTQVLINCIWDDQRPPAFILEWENELQKQSAQLGQVPAPPDRLAVIVYDFAILRWQIRSQTISAVDALRTATEIQTRIIQWSMSTMSFGEAWQYSDLEVPESPHVWNGIVHAYKSLPAAGTWNIYRILRIIITRTQELLCNQMAQPGEEAAMQAKTQHFRAVRRQMTDEICSGIPSQLGHAAPALNSPCVLITAYSSIWPLFFATTCALERVGYDVWDGFLHASQGAPSREQNTSAAAAQVAWLIGRVKYIGTHVGLRWANGFASVLKGDVRIHAEVCSGDPNWAEPIPKSPNMMTTIVGNDRSKIFESLITC